MGTVTSYILPHTYFIPNLHLRTDKDKQRWLKKFSLLETFKLAHGLAEALNYLHNDWCSSVHIIHRDLKPDNIGML